MAYRGPNPADLINWNIHAVYTFKIYFTSQIYKILLKLKKTGTPI